MLRPHDIPPDASGVRFRVVQCYFRPQQSFLQFTGQSIIMSTEIAEMIARTLNEAADRHESQQRYAEQCDNAVNPGATESLR